MAEKQYRVVFKGELAWGYRPEETRANLKRLCKYSDATLDKLFSGDPSILKESLSYEMAQKYKDALHQNGAVCIIEEMPADAAQATAAVGKTAPV
jgi:hypothetical protein